MNEFNDEYGMEDEGMYEDECEDEDVRRDEGSLYDWGEYNYQTSLYINGVENPVDPGSGFRETVKQFAMNAQYGNFRVILNGSEIESPADAPDLIQEGDHIRIAKYDKAG